MKFFSQPTIRQLLGVVIANQEKMMASINDVQQALTDLQTDVGNGFQTLTTDLQKTLSDLGATPQQIQALVDSVTGIKTGFDSAVSTLDAAIKAADPGTGSPAPAKPAGT